MRFRYLTFDCYGTLVDWRKGIAASLRAAGVGKRLGARELLDGYVAAEKEQERKYQKYSEVLRKSAMDLAHDLGTEIGEDKGAQFAASVPAWPLFPDTKGFLRKMGESGYGRFILSNVDTNILEETISRNGLEVDGYVTAEQVRGYKPGKGHWLRFLEKTGANKNEVLHVAQSIFHDIIPTQGMGIASAWVNRYREALPPAARPLLITDSLDHLGDVLENFE